MQSSQRDAMELIAGKHTYNPSSLPPQTRTTNAAQMPPRHTTGVANKCPKEARQIPLCRTGRGNKATRSKHARKRFARPPNSTRVAPWFNKGCPKPGQVWPTCPKVTRLGPKLVKVRPMLEEIRPMFADLGGRRPEITRKRLPGALFEHVPDLLPGTRPAESSLASMFRALVRDARRTAR